MVKNMELAPGTKKIFIVNCMIGIGFTFASLAHAEEGERHFKDDKGIVNVIVENDKWIGKDQHYTNGIRFSWLSSEENVPMWVKWSARHLLPFTKEGKKRISLAIGQSMFTPADITQPDLIANDRPYAGWLYSSIGEISDTGKAYDTIVLTLGAIGPHSYAEETQKFVHHAIGSPEPRGWNNQLAEEAGIKLTYEHKWRAIYEFSPFGLGTDISPHIGGNLGNINTDLSVGTTLRLGYDLPADYGPPRIRPSLPGSDFFIPTERLGGYIFTTLEGRGVARNIFLDGNTLGGSHDVKKEPFIASLQAGAALTYRSMRLSYTYVILTKEFKTQQNTDAFNAITFSYRF